MWLDGHRWNSIKLTTKWAIFPTERVQISEETRRDYSVSHDFTKFDEGASRYLDQFHFNGYNMRCMPGNVAGQTRFSNEYKRFHRIMYEPVIELLPMSIPM